MRGALVRCHRCLTPLLYCESFPTSFQRYFHSQSPESLLFFTCESFPQSFPQSVSRVTSQSFHLSISRVTSQSFHLSISRVTCFQDTDAHYLSISSLSTFGNLDQPAHPDQHTLMRWKLVGPWVLGRSCTSRRCQVFKERS
jgi:hypothetical protein